MRHRRWIVLALVFLGIVINYIDRGNLSIATPSLMRDFLITPAAMGWLLSAFFWTYAIFQIPAGMLVDRYGIRRTYAVGFLVWSLASAGIAYSRGPGDVFSLRLLLGLAESIAPLASIAFIRSNFEGKDQGLPTSIYIAGQNVGPAVGALVGAILLDRFGWRMMFLITGLGALFWLPGWWLAVPPDGSRASRQAERAKDDPAAPRSWTWRALFANRVTWALTLAIMLSSYFWYFVLTWIPSYLILARGFSTLGMGRVVSTALFAMAVANVVGGAVADKWAARVGVFPARLWCAVVGWAGTAAILLLLVVPSRSWALPILMFAMCATGIGNSSFWAIAQYVPPRNLVGRAIGFLNGMAVIAGGTAPVVTGWILGPHKQFGPAILVAGICPALAALCMLVAGSEGLARVKALLAVEAHS